MSARRWSAVGAVSLAALLLAPAARPQPAPPDEGTLGTVDGARVYAQVCQGCHMAGNPNLAAKTFVAAVVLHGRRNMPAFAPEAAPAPFFEPVVLTDVQVANVVNHVRTHFGNHFTDPITAAEVAALHSPDQEKDR